MLGCFSPRVGEAERGLGSTGQRAPPCDNDGPHAFPGRPARPAVVLMSSPVSRIATASPRIALGGIGLAAIGAIAASGKAIIVKLGLRHGVDAPRCSPCAC